MKIPMTPSGIEPTTFRFVAQHVNHCATAVVLRVLMLVVYLLVMIENLKSQFICLNISKNLHHTLKNSTFLTQSIHIPTGFVGGHNHLQEIHLVS